MGFRRAAAGSTRGACWHRQQAAAARPTYFFVLAWRRSAFGRAGENDAPGGAMQPGGVAGDGGGQFNPKRSRNALAEMDLMGPVSDSKMVVESYGENGIVINSTNVKGAVMLMSDSAFHWNVEGIRDVTWESLAVIPILSKKPEVFIVGTGRRMQRLTQMVTLSLREMGINVEVMDTGNACATFNVLNQEGRIVVAALLPLEKTEDIANDSIESGSKGGDDILGVFPPAYP